MAREDAVCRWVLQAVAVSTCSCSVGAETRGVSLVHGNALSFFTDFEEMFKAVFTHWLYFDMARDRVEDSPGLIKREIMALPPYIPGTYNTSHCSRVEGMEDIMVRRLQSLVNHV